MRFYNFLLALANASFKLIFLSKFTATVRIPVLTLPVFSISTADSKMVPACLFKAFWFKPFNFESAILMASESPNNSDLTFAKMYFFFNCASKFASAVDCKI